MAKSLGILTAGVTTGTATVRRTAWVQVTKTLTGTTWEAHTTTSGRRVFTTQWKVQTLAVIKSTLNPAAALIKTQTEASVRSPQTSSFLMKIGI